MSKIKKTDPPSVDEEEEPLKLSDTAVENVKWCKQFGQQFASFLKT